MKATPHDTDEQLRAVLAAFPNIELALLFGSVGRGQEHPQSYINVAVAFGRALSAAQKIALIEAWAERTGRPGDLVDLRTVGEPLLGQILRQGSRLLGSDNAWTAVQPPPVRPDGLHALPRQGAGGKEGCMDREVIEQKLESLRHCLKRIEQKCPADAQTLAPRDLKDIDTLNPRRAAQVSIARKHLVDFTGFARVVSPKRTQSP
jgi:predicted nucleotidyltransferase